MHTEEIIQEESWGTTALVYFLLWGWYWFQHSEICLFPYFEVSLILPFVLSCLYPELSEQIALPMGRDCFFWVWASISSTPSHPMKFCHFKAITGLYAFFIYFQKNQPFDITGITCNLHLKTNWLNFKKGHYVICISSPWWIRSQILEYCRIVFSCIFFFLLTVKTKKYTLYCDTVVVCVCACNKYAWSVVYIHRHEIKVLLNCTHLYRVLWSPVFSTVFYFFKCLLSLVNWFHNHYQVSTIM